MITYHRVLAVDCATVVGVIERISAVPESSEGVMEGGSVDARQTLGAEHFLAAKFLCSRCG